ncbi:MAG: T9SS type A sorting domain-containing protein [Bacteroidota bacterium]
MKRTVTLFTLLLLVFSVQIAAAQQCPTIESLTAKAADQQLLPAQMLEGTTGTYFTLAQSDLTSEQKHMCLLSRGAHAKLPKLSADDPLASVLGEVWENEAWVNNIFFEVFYNGDLQTQFVSNEWDGASWVPAERQTIVARDNNGFVSESIFDTWSGTEWVSMQRILSEWDDMGNQLRFEGQELENGEWNSLFISETVITDESSITISQGEDESTGMFENFSRETIEFDDQGRESIRLFEAWNGDMSAWEFLTRETKTYQDNMVTELSQFPDGMGGWFNFEQTVFTLNDAGLPIEELSSSLLLGTADPSNRILSTYNDMDLLIEELDQLPDGAGGWFTDFAYFATYDSDGDPIEEIYQIDDGTGKRSALVNDERDTYNYGQTATSVEDELGGVLTSFDIYPSPAQGRVQVEVTLEQPAALAVDVFDVLGRRVHQMADEQAAAGTQQFAWEPGDMPAGMYFIRITLDERAQTRPLMLMK